MNFSQRTAWDLSENDFATAVRKARAAGRGLLDLTVSNPTACGFTYDVEKLLAPLSNAAALSYEPLPFGMLSARKAVGQYYADHDATVLPEHICLTTSTSEAYSFLFRLLCDPGDEVLIATPSYPLFDFIAGLENVTLKEYHLLYDSNWEIDLRGLESAITTRTRAIVVVHPNNPTGNYVSVADRAALDDLCRRYGLALVVDEVFLDYPLSEADSKSFAARTPSALTFILSGISKVCALPQMKMSWIAAVGPETLVKAAMERLEFIADVFLSVNAPTQHALPQWLESRSSVQGEIHERTRLNLELIEARLRGTHADLLTVRGGWTAVLRVPRYVDGSSFVTAALDEGVVVQPGSFYGLSEGHVVVSLLTPSDLWERGIASLPV